MTTRMMLRMMKNTNKKNRHHSKRSVDVSRSQINAHPTYHLKLRPNKTTFLTSKHLIMRRKKKRIRQLPRSRNCTLSQKRTTMTRSEWRHKPPLELNSNNKNIWMLDRLKRKSKLKNKLKSSTHLEVKEKAKMIL